MFIRNHTRDPETEIRRVDVDSLGVQGEPREIVAGRQKSARVHRERSARPVEHFHDERTVCEIRK